MRATTDPDSLGATLPADVLQALLAQSVELLVVTDAAGTIAWVNERFKEATGVDGNGETKLLDCTPEGASGESTRAKLAAALASDRLETTGLRLRAADGAGFTMLDPTPEALAKLETIS